MVIMGMHIDEARSYYLTCSVDHFLGMGISQVTHGINTIGGDCHITGKRFGPGAIDDTSSADEQITSIWRAVDAHRGRAPKLFCLRE
jgi:hypothetical protein